MASLTIKFNKEGGRLVSKNHPLERERKFQTLASTLNSCVEFKTQQLILTTYFSTHHPLNFTENRAERDVNIPRAILISL